MRTTNRHHCLIYSGDPADHLPRLIPAILHHLDIGYRCLVLGNPGMIGLMHANLHKAGVDVLGSMKSGKLILSSNQGHLKDGQFEIKAMLTMLNQTVEKAISDGFKGLWASGDMTWEFGPERNLAKLLEYECALEGLFRTQPALTGVCQYHQDTLPLDMIGNGLCTHQTVYVNHTLQRVNPFYLQPESLRFKQPTPVDAAAVHQMLQLINKAA